MNSINYDFDELEISVLKVLKKLREKGIIRIGVKELVDLIDNKEINKDNILKILYWLETKGLVKLEEKKREILFVNYREEVLPEEYLFNLLKEKKEVNLEDIKEINGFNIAIGELKKNKVIDIKNGKIVLIKDHFKSYVRKLDKKLKEGKLLEEEEKKYLEKRGLLGKKEAVEYFVLINEKIENIDFSKLKIKINKLTKQDIKSGRWKELGVKKYGINDPVSKIWGGRKHPLTVFIDKIKEIWLSMGFKEQKYEIIVPALLNFDVLMVPHDHLAREMQDTFYIEFEEGSNTNLNEFKDLLERTKEVHNRFYGFFDENESKRMLIRTQDTVVSAYFLYKVMQNKEKIPTKIFSIGKVFRNETIDKTHLAEFFQSEGLVIDKNLKFEDLVGFIKSFFDKLGFKKIKFKVAYFPFTEPSLEVFAYHDKLGKFIELGGAGIFRKEINEIFGIPKAYNMLAWGLGIERIAMIYYDLKDIRDLLSNRISVEFLRNYRI